MNTLKSIFCKKNDTNFVVKSDYYYKAYIECLNDKTIIGQYYYKRPCEFILDDYLKIKDKN